jgi:predicted SprT family Zn-dependent metalloprotease
MQRDDAIALAKGLIKQHLGKRWRLKLNKRHTSLGRCDFDQKVIELSIYFIDHNNADAVGEIILHEIAHALAGDTAGHGSLWAEQCRRLNIEPTVVYHDKKMPDGKWVATCNKCTRQYNKQYKPAVGFQYLCPKCNVLVEFKNNSKHCK